MFRELHPNIKMRLYTSFLSRVFGSMIFPFMAIYFTAKMGATTAGILLMSNVIIQFIAGLYGGHLADILGRKRMMVNGELLRLFATIGMVLVNSPWWTSAWLTFVMMTLSNVASGFVNPAAEAMLIDVSTKETRAFMYSVNYWAVNFSLMIGLMVGGWLFDKHFFELLIILLVMTILTFLMTVFLIQETYKTQKTSAKSFGISSVFKSYQTVMKDQAFLLFTLGGIAILSLEFQRNNFIAVRLEDEIPAKIVHLLGEFNFTLDGIKLLSLLTTENTIIIVLFTTLISKWIKGRNEQPIMYGGFILFGLGYAYLAFSNNILGLFIAVGILSVGELLYVPSRQSLLADIVDNRKRGAYMAFNGFVFQIGKLMGALGIIVGKSIGSIGMSSLYILFIIFGILLSYWSIRMKQGLKNKKLIEETLN